MLTITQVHIAGMSDGRHTTVAPTSCQEDVDARAMQDAIALVRYHPALGSFVVLSLRVSSSPRNHVRARASTRIRTRLPPTFLALLASCR
ncbi:uncharacterized protein TRAVEDRAFT_61246 [Trametes versicolor FP-101664 SS1]|uniref:uncharacterized protein n=1 Tax=Trametes versicolor (strain FP-101664) TaxID=717944 RepID=UPI00046233E8|nr:uncharacterized protein TRAVEDRAFT_61246 [Trametes versicolor FP-101664 SS1]EIW53122.1 hypothetical protein TRAVEDRAFT_61246 [Trametes versicolor FP-101664 SS1]